LGGAKVSEDKDLQRKEAVQPAPNPADREWNRALDLAASIVVNVAHTCMSDEHCDALHAAHRKAALEIRALKRPLTEARYANSQDEIYQEEVAKRG
jgi:hypothetical protein